MTVEPTIPSSSPGAGALLRLIRDGQASTRAELVALADLAATHSRLAVTDLGGEVLVEGAEEIAIAQGPDPVLAWLESTFDELLAGVGRSHDDVRGIGVGVPGPVEFATGTPVAPPIMPGWDGY